MQSNQANGEVVRVVLEIEETDEGDRIHMIGVFTDRSGLPPQKYDYRNVVNTWLDVDHDVRAFMVPPMGSS